MLLRTFEIFIARHIGDEFVEKKNIFTVDQTGMIYQHVIDSIQLHLMTS